MAFKRKVKHWCFLLGLAALIVGLSGLVWHGFHHNFHSFFQEVERFWHDDSAFILVVVGILLTSFIIRRKIHRIKVFSYFYTTKFPFVVIPSAYSDNARSMASMLDSFMHAKIYVIDNRDIFIGSANLTSSGLKHNIESFVKISAHETVKEIIAEINAYIDKNCRPININRLGARVYDEAPY